MAATLGLHPVALLAVELAVITILVGFTSLSSPWRVALLPLLVAAVCASVPTCARHFRQHSLATFVAGQQITFLLQYIEVVLLNRQAFDSAATTAQGATTTAAAAAFWARLRFGWAACTAFRRCGTSFEVQPLRPRQRYFSPSSAMTTAAPPSPPLPRPAASLAAEDESAAEVYNRARGSSAPSRAAYVRRALARFCLCYLVLDLFDLAGRLSASSSGSDDDDDGGGGRSASSLNQTLFAPERVPLFSRLGRGVTAAELAVRVASTSTGMLGAYCLINGVWNLYAAVAVGVFGADARHWTPIFGRVHDAYTLRRFWGGFWHQFNRSKLLAPARFLVVDVLRVPRRSAAARVLTLAATFTNSGVLHLAADAAVGVFLPQSGALVFFAEQPLGILLEEVVLAAAEAATAAIQSSRSWPSTSPNRDGRVTASSRANGAADVGVKAKDDDVGGRGHDSEREPHWCVRALGYAWVLAWLAWTAPRWMYPILYRMEGRERDMVLPFSLAKLVLRI